MAAVIEDVRDVARPRVRMAVYGDITYDSRVRREAAAIAVAGYDVTIVCLGAPATMPDLPTGVSVITHQPTSSSVLPRSPNPFLTVAQRGRIGRAIGRGRWFAGYIKNLRAWGKWVVATAGPVDLWHLHDLTSLAAVLPAIRQPVPVVYDSHELFLDAGTARRLPGFARKLLRRYERHLVTRVSAVVTVNDSLARVLRRRYRPREIVVVHNVPDRAALPPDRGTMIVDATGISATAKVVLYHGSIGAHRGIEQLFDAILRRGLEDVHLVLIGFGEMRETFTEQASEPEWLGRVHVLPAVPPHELMQWVASADVEAALIQPSTLNHYLSSPNKLFEAIAAGVPVVASNFPTMRRLVMENPAGPLGAVCDPTDVEAVATALRSIVELDPEDSRLLRERCRTVARELWNWELESTKLVELYRRLVD